MFQDRAMQRKLQSKLNKIRAGGGRRQMDDEL